jgi:hypothetical protein
MRTTALALTLLIGCQTRNQAKLVTVGAGSIALVGGYFEHEEGYPPVTLIGAGSIAIISIISMLFLDDHPKTLLDGAPLSWRPDDSRGGSELVAGIRRTACFGRCSAYSVAVYRDGDVEYTGSSNVTTIGSARGHLEPVQVRDLEQRLTNVLALDDDYDSHVTDIPTTYLWYRPIGGPTKFITHHGSAPEALVAAEDALDQAINVQQWIGSPTTRGH